MQREREEKQLVCSLTLRSQLIAAKPNEHTSPFIAEWGNNQLYINWIIGVMGGCEQWCCKKSQLNRN